MHVLVLVLLLLLLLLRCPFLPLLALVMVERRHQILFLLSLSSARVTRLIHPFHSSMPCLETGTPPRPAPCRRVKADVDPDA